MKRKLLFALFAVAAACFQANAQTFSGGTGTEASPYLISSKADMEALADAVNDGESYTGKHFLLTRDLTAASDTVTTVIGNSDSTPFSGNFDGGGYEIAVEIEIDTTNNTAYAGIFGYIIEATIQNLGVSGSVSASAIGYSSYSGGICGYMDGDAISNCYNTGSISSTASISYSGGICGSLNGTISNCYN